MTERSATSSQEAVQPEQQFPAASPMRIMRIIGGGLFELIFVVVCIGLILGVLNFFNVILLDTVNPSLSFLPKYAKPTPPPQLNEFRYDDAKAKNLLTSLQSGVLHSQLIPFAETDPQTVSRTDNRFYREWNLDHNTVTIHTSLTLQPKTNQESIYWVSLQTTLTASQSATFSSQSATFSSQSAKQLISTYFIYPPLTSPMRCIQNNCMQIDALPRGQTGVNITYDVTNKQATIYYCFIPNYSDIQSVLASCPLEKIQ